MTASTITETTYLRVHGSDINPNPTFHDITPGQVHSFSVTPSGTEDGEPRLVFLTGLVATKFIFDDKTKIQVTLADGTTIDFTSGSSIEMES